MLNGVIIGDNIKGVVEDRSPVVTSVFQNNTNENYLHSMTLNTHTS